MKTFILNSGHTVMVDDADFDFVSAYKWRILSNGRKLYVRRNGQWINGKRKQIRLHRELMGNPPEKYEVDHIDGDGLNNCKSNLRIVTGQQNKMNRIKRATATSRYKGVFALRDKWRAQIRFDKKKIHLGTFQNEIDGAKAYDRKAKQLFGEYANLNFK